MRPHTNLLLPPCPPPQKKSKGEETFIEKWGELLVLPVGLHGLQVHESALFWPPNFILNEVSVNFYNIEHFQALWLDCNHLSLSKC